MQWEDVHVRGGYRVGMGKVLDKSKEVYYSVENKTPKGNRYEFIYYEQLKTQRET